MNMPRMKGNCEACCQPKTPHGNRHYSDCFSAALRLQTGTCAGFNAGVWRRMEQYIRKLRVDDWFSNVGGETSLCCPTIRVYSWEDAVNATNSEISTWSRVEAGNVTMNWVRQNNPGRFSEWNEIAKSNFPIVKAILGRVDVARIPDEFRVHVLRYLQSLLVGALLEEAFDNCAAPRVLRKSVEAYNEGAFACGWYVEAPDQFPDKASLLIY